MPASQSSSKRVVRLALTCLLLLAAAAGCATVKPQDKELLADPLMGFDASAMARRHEDHVLDNREGSYGGGSARGGGCGCN